MATKKKTVKRPVVEAFRGNYNGFDYLIIDDEEVGFSSGGGVWRVGGVPLCRRDFDGTEGWTKLSSKEAKRLYRDWKKKTTV